MANSTFLDYLTTIYPPVEQDNQENQDNAMSVSEICAIIMVFVVVFVGLRTWYSACKKDSKKGCKRTKKIKTRELGCNPIAFEEDVPSYIV